MIYLIFGTGLSHRQHDHRHQHDHIQRPSDHDSAMEKAQDTVASLQKWPLSEPWGFSGERRFAESVRGFNGRIIRTSV